MSGALLTMTCAACGHEFKRKAVYVRRNMRCGHGVNYYCSRKCAGAAKRKDVSEKKARRAGYDKARRMRSADSQAPSPELVKREARRAWVTAYIRAKTLKGVHSELQR